jgi:serine/threonine protein kinase
MEKLNSCVQIDKKLSVDFNKSCGKGSGIFCGTFTQQKEKVAVAVHIFETRSLSPGQMHSLEMEIHNLKKLKNHPNIIQYYYDLALDGRIYLALEECSKGDLQQFLD